MLTNEYFKIVTTIRNEFHLTLENVGFSITVPSSLQNKVFIAADMTKSRQKLMSVFQVDIGDVAPQSEKSIAFYAISLIEGSHELLQNVWYEMESSEHQMIQKSTAAETTKNHNISIERINDVVVKSKKETIIVPCTAEFLFTGKFFTLNREPLVQAFRHEDFLFRVDLEVKSIEIDILDMFMICVCSESNFTLILHHFNITFSIDFISGLQYHRKTIVQSQAMEIWTEIQERREDS